MIAADLESRRYQCRTIQRLIEDAEDKVQDLQRELEEAISRRDDVVADLSNIDPLDILSRRALQEELARREGARDEVERRLRIEERKLDDLLNEFEIEQCRRLL